MYGTQPVKVSAHFIVSFTRIIAGMRNVRLFVWNQTLRFYKSDFKVQFRLSAWLFYSMLFYSMYCTYTVHCVHVNTWFNAAARVLFWQCGFVLIRSHSISDLFIFLQSHPCNSENSLRYFCIHSNAEHISWLWYISLLKYMSWFLKKDRKSDTIISQYIGYHDQLHIK